jgi:Flp pilus assembly protein TadD/TolB-like protein
VKHILLILFAVLIVLPAQADKIAIAVLDIEAKGEELTPSMGQALTEKVRFEVAKNQNFDLVAREKMVELTREKALQLTGITNDSTAVKIGKALNVKTMVFGSVTKLGQGFTLYLRAVDVESEKVECSETENAGESTGSLGNYAPDPVQRLLACMLIKVRREAVEKAPQDAEAHFYLAAALGGKGKYGEAEREYREALRLEPDHQKARFNLGVALLAQGRTGEAEAELREAIRLNPNDARAHAQLCSALDMLGRYDEAEREARSTIRLDPDIPEGHSVLGVELMRKKKYSEAEREFREFLRQKPDEVSVVIALANVIDQQGRKREARVWWEQALKLEKRPEWIQTIKDRLAKPD